MSNASNSESQPPTEHSQSTAGPALNIRERVKEYVDLGCRVTGLEKITFVPLAAGAIGLAFLLLTTLGTWYSWSLEGSAAGMPISRYDWYRGISYTEGKWIATLVLAAGAFLAIGVINRKWLAGVVLGCGGVGIFSAIVMLFLRYRMARDYFNDRSEIEKTRDMIEKNPMAKFGAESTGFEVPEVAGGPSWLLGFAILLAIGIAIAFLIPSLRTPPSIKFFQKPEYPPFLQKYGTVVAGYALALLLGLVFAFMWYA